MDTIAQTLDGDSTPHNERNKVELSNATYDGDHEPTLIRRMSLIRKWIIVVIISTGTVCV